MNAITATDARTIVTASAQTAATASKGHWFFGDHTATITRRTLSSGLVRIQIRLVRRYIPGAQANAERVERRDLPADQADALFAAQLTKWNTFHQAAMAA